jgi:hypothetical protein
MSAAAVQELEEDAEFVVPVAQSSFWDCLSCPAVRCDLGAAAFDVGFDCGTSASSAERSSSAAGVVVEEVENMGMGQVVVALEEGIVVEVLSSTFADSAACVEKVHTIGAGHALKVTRLKLESWIAGCDSCLSAGRDATTSALQP